jgi:Tfp pilus assembly protein PilV
VNHVLSCLRFLRALSSRARGSHPRLRADDGSALVEVLVGAVLVVIVAVGVLGAIDSATRATAEERHRAQAHTIAQDDLARMRSMRISDLSNLFQTRTVTIDAQRYTVLSEGRYVTDATGTSSCEAGTASADYIETTSTVTWPSMGSRPPVVLNSIVAPPNGTVSETAGALAVGIEGADGEGIPGIVLTGTGASAFSGQTGSNGCAIFGNLPAGNYTLTVQVAGDLVDKDGKSPAPQTTSVVAGSTNTLVLVYDEPGTIPVRFQTRDYTDTVVDSTADSIVVFNTGMTTPRTFGVTTGPPVNSIEADGLFPFTSPYSVYAGTCQGNNPDPAGSANPPPSIASVGVPPGGPALATTLLLPALHLTVYEGIDSSSPPAANATVEITDLNCSDHLRTYTTNALGRLDDPGLPVSDYSVCAEGQIAGVARHNTIGPVTVEDTATPVVRDIPLTGAGSTTGPCP